MAAARQPACRCRESRRGRRSREAAVWAVPGIGLLLIPKCPMCLAAWLALAGWTSASFAAASLLREGLVWLCLGAMAWMASRALKDLARRHRQRRR